MSKCPQTVLLLLVIVYFVVEVSQEGFGGKVVVEVVRVLVVASRGHQTLDEGSVDEVLANESV